MPPAGSLAVPLPVRGAFGQHALDEVLNVQLGDAALSDRCQVTRSRSTPEFARELADRWRGVGFGAGDGGTSGCGCGCGCGLPAGRGRLRRRVCAGAATGSGAAACAGAAAAAGAAGASAGAGVAAGAGSCCSFGAGFG